MSFKFKFHDHDLGEKKLSSSKKQKPVKSINKSDSKKLINEDNYDTKPDKSLDSINLPKTSAQKDSYTISSDSPVIKESLQYENKDKQLRIRSNSRMNNILQVF